MTLKFNSVLEVVKVCMFMPNFINLSAAVHALLCPQAFLPYSLWCKMRKSGPVTLAFNLWPWNFLGFVRSSRNTLMQNFIKPSAAVNELSCVQWKKLRRKQYSPLLPLSAIHRQTPRVLGRILSSVVVNMISCARRLLFVMYVSHTKQTTAIQKQRIHIGHKHILQAYIVRTAIDVLFIHPIYVYSAQTYVRLYTTA